MINKPKRRFFIRTISSDNLSSITDMFAVPKRGSKSKIYVSNNGPTPSNESSRSTEPTQPEKPIKRSADRTSPRISSNEYGTEFAYDIHDSYREMEQETSVKPIYMEYQSYITKEMRSVLIDWLVEVQLKFKLTPDTLYLTVNIIDRFLKENEVIRQNFQLVGATCILIASKYEEIHPVKLRNLVYICNGSYSKEKILNMESKILNAMNFRITAPTAHSFSLLFMDVANADKTMFLLSSYILEGTLQSYTLLHYYPSQLSAASIFISRNLLGKKAWTSKLRNFTMYNEDEIIPIARAILSAKKAKSKELQAVTKKYSSSKYGGVAKMFSLIGHKI